MVNNLFSFAIDKFSDSTSMNWFSDGFLNGEKLLKK
jgi:hypothetical protein